MWACGVCARYGVTSRSYFTFTSFYFDLKRSTNETAYTVFSAEKVQLRSLSSVITRPRLSGIQLSMRTTYTIGVVRACSVVDI